jgi:uracil-DNA glycosylase family protein
MPPKFPGAAEFLPKKHSLESLRKAVQNCHGCDLYRNATQGVMGEGPVRARILLIGEQPGNEEDLQGHPFVGPAGRLLDRALEEAGIPRSEVFVTNVVKHFKFEERGKRRIHKKPNAAEVNACQPWLEAEIAEIQPKVVVCLGATAAQALLGRNFRLTLNHGQFFEHPWASYVTAALHPSAILRAPDEDERHSQFRQLVDDLRSVAEILSPKRISPK